MIGNGSYYHIQWATGTAAQSAQVILSLSSGDWLEAQSAIFMHLECIIITAIIYCMFHAGQILC